MLERKTPPQHASRYCRPIKSPKLVSARPPVFQLPAARKPRISVAAGSCTAYLSRLRLDHRNDRLFIVQKQNLNFSRRLATTYFSRRRLANHAFEFRACGPRIGVKCLLQPIPADMRLLFSKGIPYFLLPNLDSVNHCTSKEISTETKRYLL